MTLPNNFNNLVYAIETHLVSGSGLYPNIIPTGSYSLNWYYENRDASGLSQDSLAKDQLRVKINSFSDANAWLQPNTKMLYDVEIAVDIATHLDSKILKNRRSDIETGLANKSLGIQRTLTDPFTMLTGSSGNETGLVSGRLQFIRYQNPKFDYVNSVATATCLFSGKVALSRSNV